MESAKDMHAKIVGKASEDADFRSRLLSDPKGAIEQELGVTIPASLSIEVHEQSAETTHLVLPPDSKLSERDLQTVAGGTFDPNPTAMSSASITLDWVIPPDRSTVSAARLPLGAGQSPRACRQVPSP